MYLNDLSREHSIIHILLLNANGDMYQLDDKFSQDLAAPSDVLNDIPNDDGYFFELINNVTETKKHKKHDGSDDYGGDAALFPTSGGDSNEGGSSEDQHHHHDHGDRRATSATAAAGAAAEKKGYYYSREEGRQRMAAKAAAAKADVSAADTAPTTTSTAAGGLDSFVGGHLRSRRSKRRLNELNRAAAEAVFAADCTKDTAVEGETYGPHIQRRYYQYSLRCLYCYCCAVSLSD